MAALAGFTGVSRLHLARIRHGDMVTLAASVIAAGLAALAIVWFNLRPPTSRSE